MLVYYTPSYAAPFWQQRLIMFKKLYTRFITPSQRDPDTKNRVIVLNVLLAGTLFLLIGACLVLVYDILALGLYQLWSLTATLSGVAMFIGLLYRFSRSGHHKLAAGLLVLSYFLIGSFAIYQWSIMLPTGILVYGLVIVLSGILLGPKFSLYSAGACSLLLFLFEYAASFGLIHPDISWLNVVPSEGDAFATALLFVVLALVSWLFNFQMHRSLRRATKAEAALTKQKGLLETTVKERTSELQAAQLEKIQHMYRFAELGQLSTALLHDLSNHLTTLTLDIEGLKGQTRSRALTRSRRSIRYIDEMVVQVRNQLLGKHRIRPFNVADEIDAVVALLKHRAHAVSVVIDWSPPADKKPLRCRGEPIRFRQLVANLVSNAIEAYDSVPSSDKRRVLVTAETVANRIIITISDWGKGIPRANRPKLFEPFYSTKKTGMGMGLFIVKQIAEEHFLGSVVVNNSKKHSSFVVTLPGTMHDA